MLTIFHRPLHYQGNYMYDTMFILHKDKIVEFTNHLNSQHPSSSPMKSHIAMLVTMITRDDNGLVFSVYHKLMRNHTLVSTSSLMVINPSPTQTGSDLHFPSSEDRLLIEWSYGVKTSTPAFWANPNGHGTYLGALRPLPTHSWAFHLYRHLIHQTYQRRHRL